jgi:DNA-directed RNA polymerase subunit RPC12/RpoP
MLKLWDYQCLVCGHIHERLAKTAPSTMRLRCPRCQCKTKHEKRFPLVAEYHGEKTHNPVVYGGRFDTMGAVKPNKLPPLPVGDPETDPVSGRTSRGVTFDQLYDYTKANRELIHANREIKKQNLAKKKRAAALKRGEAVNMRRDRCIGDPKGI